jgi:hypothetical protein
LRGTKSAVIFFEMTLEIPPSCDLSSFELSSFELRSSIFDLRSLAPPKRRGGKFDRASILSETGDGSADLAGVKTPAYVCNSGSFSDQISTATASKGRPEQE